MDASENAVVCCVIVANCCGFPSAIDGLAGDAGTDIIAAVTVKVVKPVTLPRVALIVEVPICSAEASPVALIVATVVVPEPHTTLFVRSCVELSLNVPVAVNCCVFPAATDGFVGVTAIDTSACCWTNDPSLVLPESV